MEILIIDRQKMLGPTAIKRAESKAAAAFSKFGHNISSIDISVQDINGPRGGVDKECRVIVKLMKMNDFAVSVKDDSLSKAVSNAINRAARSVARQLDRRLIRDGSHFSRFSLEG